MSPIVLEWLELEDAGELLGHMWADRIHPEDQELTVAAANQLQAGTNPAPYLQRWLTTAGREILIQVDVWWWDRPHGVRRLTGRLTNYTVNYATIPAAVAESCAEIFRHADGETAATSRGPHGGMPSRHDGVESDRPQRAPQTPEAAPAPEPETVSAYAPSLTVASPLTTMTLLVLMFAAVR